LPIYYCYENIPEWGINYNTYKIYFSNNFNLLNYTEIDKKSNKKFLYFLLSKK
jgi:hypothetical protein